MNMDVKIASSAPVAPYLFRWELRWERSFFAYCRRQCAAPWGRGRRDGNWLRMLGGDRAQRRCYRFFLPKFVTAYCCNRCLYWA